jgi:hypothetical protein
MPESKPSGYRGWWRPHKRAPWQAVVKAARFADCWGDLLQFMADQPPSVGSESMVLEVGREPYSSGGLSAERRTTDAQ